MTAYRRRVILPTLLAPRAYDSINEEQFRAAIDTRIAALEGATDPGGTSSSSLTFIQSGTGAVTRDAQDKMREHVTSDDFEPAAGWGANDANDIAALTAFITECMSSARPGFITPRQHLISKLDITMTANLDLFFENGASIKGTAGSSDPVLEFDGGASRYRLRLYGATVDNSLRTFVSADASGTALSLLRLGEGSVIFEPNLLSTDDYRDEMGDSGITVNQCERMWIVRPLCRGQPDLGIYITGGPDGGSITDDRGDIIVESPIFYRCAAALSNKRTGQRVIVSNPIVYECRVGMSNLEAVSSATEIDPGRELIVNGGYFKRIGSRAVLGKGRIVFTNNYIEDWGSDPDGVINSGGDAGFDFALRIHGSYGVYTNNVFKMREWSEAGREAIRIDTDVLDSGTLTPVGNFIDGNIISDCDFGIVEEDAGVTGNHGSNIFATNVGTPITLATGSASKYDILREDGTRQVMAGALVTGRTSGDTLLLQAYDTNTGPAYVTFGTLTAGNTPSFTLGSTSLPITGTFLNTGLKIVDTNASHALTLAPGTNLTGDRTLTLTTPDANQTIDTTTAGAITVDSSTFYSGIPQNSKSADYTLVLSDAQKHIFHPTADNNPRTFTIPANSSVAYPIGTVITFINEINTITIAITSDTLNLAGAGGTGSRTLAANGMATAIKTASTSWWISGTGLT